MKNRKVSFLLSTDYHELHIMQWRIHVHSNNGELYAFKHDVDKGLYDLMQHYKNRTLSIDETHFVDLLMANNQDVVRVAIYDRREGE